MRNAKLPESKFKEVANERLKFSEPFIGKEASSKTSSSRSSFGDKNPIKRFKT